MPRRTTHITQTYDTATNACGRLLRVDDGTGYRIFSYDKLGNISENFRTFALPFEDSVYNFRMLFEYDSWNRVQRIVYPDSEVVMYNYDLGGQLCRVHTYKSGHRDTLIKNILYDEFGHRTQVNFGNGVTTNYTYDNLQRLNTLQTYSNNASLQKISYSFDLEDNITRVENTAGGANGLGGAYVNTYNYDDLYRLTSANGTYSGNNTSYSLEMSYTPAGRLCSKLQDFTATANTYAYSPNNKPHAVRRIYNGLTNELYNLRWDNNGNLAQQTVYSVANNTTTYQGMRYLQWDEDDRLNLVAGDGYLSYYAYGHDGNRAIKMTGNAAIDQSGTLLNSTNLENITIYPNEYLTVTQAEYTKYYYAGGNRIASKIGTGGFEKMTRLCTLDQGPTYNANTLLNFVLYQVTNISNQPNDEYPVDVCGGYSISTEFLTNPLPDFFISNTALNFTQNNLLQQFRQNLTNAVEPVYYFHSDHLGSASWISDGTGGAVQHLLYLPFGEHFVNERSAAYDERFTFTGKEKDIETGYYYFGARFDNVDLGFMSVDPMTDKYPSLTPYNYCAWNPIIFYDPDGNEKLIFFDIKYPKQRSFNGKGAYQRFKSAQAKCDSNRILYKNAQNYKDHDGVVHLFAHGHRQHVDFAENGVKDAIGAELLLLQYSETYKKNMVEGNPTLLIMHSCETGKGKNSIAQQLSKRTDGDLLVFAPSEKLLLGDDENVANNGTWNVFYKGELIGKYRGDIDFQKQLNGKNIQNVIKYWVNKYNERYANE